MLRLTINPLAPDGDALQVAASAILKGGVVAIPTDTLYGLAADPFNAVPVARLFALKARSGERAVPLIAASARQVEEALGTFAPLARRLSDCFWPGPLTLLIPASERLAPQVTGGTGRVGVRVPAHRVAQALCEICGLPLTATSANISGEPAQSDPGRVASSVGSLIDVLLDAGHTPGGLPSTIVDVTGPRPALVRAGAISWEEVTACLQRG